MHEPVLFLLNVGWIASVNDAELDQTVKGIWIIDLMFQIKVETQHILILARVNLVERCLFLHLFENLFEVLSVSLDSLVKGIYSSSDV